MSRRVADSEVIVPTSEQVLERLAHGKLIVPNCSEQLFEEIAHAKPYLRMNLIEGQLESMPFSRKRMKKYCLDAKEFDIIGQLYVWCRANKNLVGQGGASQGAFRVPNSRGGFNILGPDASVILSPRWNAFLANQPPRRPGEPNYPEVTPNFIIEIRSESDTALDVDRKMNLWMRGGAEGRRDIDRSFYKYNKGLYLGCQHQYYHLSRDSELYLGYTDSFTTSSRICVEYAIRPLM
ncbi:10014_t:CDS:2, partial [Paraglomus occultum]